MYFSMAIFIAGTQGFSIDPESGSGIAYYDATPPGNEHIPFQGSFESMILLFPRWDMSVPWRV